MMLLVRFPYILRQFYVRNDAKYALLLLQVITLSCLILNDVNNFRDIFIEAFKTVKEDQADIDPGESSKCMYILTRLAPNYLYFSQDNLTKSSCRDSRVPFQKL